MELNKIDHVGITVSDLEKTLKIYTQVLGVSSESIQRKEVSGRVKIAIIPVGQDKIELLEFLDKNNKPVADLTVHVAINIQDISGNLERLKIQGVPLVDEKPRLSPFGHKVAFINPKEAGITFELVESQE